MEQENDQHQLLPQSRSKYIITIYHHDECLELLNDYYIPQILCCKEKVNELGLPIDIKVYLFTSVCHQKFDPNWNVNNQNSYCLNINLSNINNLYQIPHHAPNSNIERFDEGIP